MRVDLCAGGVGWLPAMAGNFFASSHALEYCFHDHLCRFSAGARRAPRGQTGDAEFHRHSLAAGEEKHESVVRKLDSNAEEIQTSDAEITEDVRRIHAGAKQSLAPSAAFDSRVSRSFNG